MSQPWDCLCSRHGLYIVHRPSHDNSEVPSQSQSSAQTQLSSISAKLSIFIYPNYHRSYHEPLLQEYIHIRVHLHRSKIKIMAESEYKPQNILPFSLLRIWYVNYLEVGSHYLGNLALVIPHTSHSIKLTKTCHIYKVICFQKPLTKLQVLFAVFHAQ